MIHELFGCMVVYYCHTPHDCIYMEMSPANSNLAAKCWAFVVAFEQGDYYSSCHIYCDMGLRFLWSPSFKQLHFL